MSFFQRLAFFKNRRKSPPKSPPLVRRNIHDTEQAIASLLKQLQQHIIIITAHFPDDRETYNTSIINIDFQHKLFQLDEFIPRQGNSQIKRLKKVRLRARLDGTMLITECSLKEAGLERGMPHYVMHFPSLIRTIQRRDSFRVNIPLSKRYQVNMQTESGSFIAGFLNNISYSGLAIRLEAEQESQFDIDDIIPILTLHLDQSISCEMHIKRISSTAANTIVAGRLRQISSLHQQSIQKFIARLDREKRRQNREEQSKLTALRQ